MKTSPRNDQSYRCSASSSHKLLNLKSMKVARVDHGPSTQVFSSIVISHLLHCSTHYTVQLHEHYRTTASNKINQIDSDKQEISGFCLFKIDLELSANNLLFCSNWRDDRNTDIPYFVKLYLLYNFSIISLSRRRK